MTTIIKGPLLATSVTTLENRYSGDTNELLSSKVKSVKTTCMVHCNFGWGGLFNGYFASGVFDLGSKEAEFDDISQKKARLIINGIYIQSLMKKGVKLMLMAYIVADCLTGCDRVEEHYSHSYILEYYRVDSYGFREVPSYDGKFDFNIEIGKRVTFLSKGRDKEIFDSLCVRNGDIAYDRKVELIAGIIAPMCPYPDRVSLSVTCRGDFDAKHPSGTPLDDCIDVTYSSAYDYVHSGYNIDVYSAVEERTKTLSDMTQEDWQLQTRSPVFAFTKDPDVKEVKYLTAVIKTSDGKVHTVNFKYDFKEGHLSQVAIP